MNESIFKNIEDIKRNDRNDSQKDKNDYLSYIKPKLDNIFKSKSYLLGLMLGDENNLFDFDINFTSNYDITMNIYYKVISDLVPPKDSLNNDGIYFPGFNNDLVDVLYASLENIESDIKEQLAKSIYNIKVKFSLIDKNSNDIITNYGLLIKHFPFKLYTRYFERLAHIVEKYMPDIKGKCVDLYLTKPELTSYEEISIINKIFEIHDIWIIPGFFDKMKHKCSIFLPPISKIVPLFTNLSGTIHIYESYYNCLSDNDYNETNIKELNKYGENVKLDIFKINLQPTLSNFNEFV